MKNKGFTLIELIAVILILGIIALIAIPAVANAIEDSKKKSAEVTALSYIKAIDDQNALYKLQPDKFTPINSGNVEDLEVNIKGDGPKEGTVTVINGKVTEATLCASGYNVTYNGVSATVGNKCGEEDDGTVKLKGLAKKVFKANTLIEDNPTLTNTSSATNESGFYASTSTNSGNPTYYFRGNVDNNNVRFAEQDWKIIRINEDGTVRLIMNQGINNNTTYHYHEDKSVAFGTYYTYTDNPGHAQTALNTWYETNITNKGYGNKVATGAYFCEQAKVRPSTSFNNVGNASMDPYDSYVPTFACVDDDGNGKGKVSAPVGLITYDEAVYAGGKYSSSNTTFYLYTGNTTWTMSPGGRTYATVWYTGHSSNSIGASNTSTNSYTFRPVINLKANVDATGDGTTQSPYIVE